MGIMDWFGSKDNKEKKAIKVEKKVSLIDRFEERIKKVARKTKVIQNGEQWVSLQLRGNNITKGFTENDINKIIDLYKKILEDKPDDETVKDRIKIAEMFLEHYKDKSSEVDKDDNDAESKEINEYVKNVKRQKKLKSVKQQIDDIEKIREKYRKPESPEVKKIEEHIKQKMQNSNLAIEKQKDKFFDIAKDLVKKGQIYGFGACNIFASNGDNDFNFLVPWTWDNEGFHFQFPERYPDWFGSEIEISDEDLKILKKNKENANKTNTEIKKFMQEKSKELSISIMKQSTTFDIRWRAENNSDIKKGIYSSRMNIILKSQKLEVKKE